MWWLEQPAGELAPDLSPSEAQPRHQDVRIALELFVETSTPITHLVHPGDGSHTLYIVEKRGRVVAVTDGQILATPVLDIEERVKSSGSEQGLFSIALDEEGRLFVDYTDLEGDTVIERFERTEEGFSLSNSEVLLRIEQPAANHNGGQLAFGPDGMLYIGTGDGGLAHDPWDNAESLDTLLGKLLRIDVSGTSGYANPSDNPFVDRQGARAEIWAYGLRNPWRFSFDRKTADLYVADVGQNDWEEVTFQPNGDTAGKDYGWDTLEGLHCHEPREGCESAGTLLPVATYGHELGCSITGGHVYRGRRIPALQGTYLFADYCSGRIWGLDRREDGRWTRQQLIDTELNIASFGEDALGELYVLDLKGGVYRIVAREG
jgi:glucose/arabinose dehydrogenase